ncbi:hypothetical protein D018_0719B, partial [Vibrio parahaemolyticus VP2007-007]
FEL